MTYLRPEGDNEWFSIFVLHQNRAQNRGLKNYIPESALPEHLDLVIWGHEHDCKIDPERSENGPFIIQPGTLIQIRPCVTKLNSLPSIIKYIHVTSFLKYYKAQIINYKIILLLELFFRRLPEKNYYVVL